MKRPNILILYTDQQRWDALGANGNPHIHTPNLDRLARQGVNFNHYFVQNPVCMPSRVQFSHRAVSLPVGNYAYGRAGANGYTHTAADAQTLWLSLR